MKDLINTHFENMIESCYGSAMITKDQKTDMKLSFVSGMMIALKISMNDVRDLNDLKQLNDAIEETFHETNNNR